MNKRLCPIVLCALLIPAMAAQAQTTQADDGTDTSTTATTGGTATSDTSSDPTPSGDGTATEPQTFESLSPGNQKIARSLYDAHLNSQLSGEATSTSVDAQPGLTLNDIAAMKQDGAGWGQAFKQMQANGQISSDVKNLGQVISGYNHSQKVNANAAGGSMVTTGTGVQGTKGSGKSGRSSVSGNTTSNAVRLGGHGRGHNKTITNGMGASNAGINGHGHGRFGGGASHATTVSNGVGASGAGVTSARGGGERGNGKSHGRGKHK